jgi:hypothetical protein
MRTIRRLLALLLVLGGVFVAVLAFPEPNFEYRLSHGQYEIFSDRPIPPQIAAVLDDTTRRLERSELYDSRQRFRIFFCNDDWRMALYSQRFSSAPGGIADTWLTRNIYLRRSDIAGGRMTSPTGAALADAEVRPLAYFIAHEATHVMEARAFGRLLGLLYPSWLTEGYADYVAKGGGFDFEENRRMLAAGDPLLDPARTQIYRRHHLLVALLMDEDGLSIRRIFADPPEEEVLLRRLRAER